MPRAPSLELCVLPSGGGQPIQSGLTESLHWNSTSYRKRPATESSVGATTNSGCMPENGAEGARTPDLLGAIQALSQLSYSPAHAGTGEPTRSLAPGSPEDNSPATFAGPRSSCWMITAFAGRVKRMPCLLDGPGHHPSRVIVPAIHARCSDDFQYLQRRAMGGDPTTFVVSQTAHTPPGVVPPPLHLPRACNARVGGKGPATH